MLGRFVRWWRARRARQERLLFEYFDGRWFRKVDPWQTHRALFSDPHFNAKEHLQLVAAGAEPEYTHCLECICNAFGCRRFDSRTGRGLTDQELLALLDAFWDFCDELQKKTGHSPTSSPVTVSGSSVGPECQPQTTS